jgi:hypothetical protein
MKSCCAHPRKCGAEGSRPHLGVHFVEREVPLIVELRISASHIHVCHVAPLFHTKPVTHQLPCVGGGGQVVGAGGSAIGLHHTLRAEDPGWPPSWASNFAPVGRLIVTVIISSFPLPTRRIGSCLCWSSDCKSTSSHYQTMFIYWF